MARVTTLKVIVISTAVLVILAATYIGYLQLAPKPVGVIRFGVFAKGFYGLAPLYVAMEKGYFEEEGVRVEEVELRGVMIESAAVAGELEGGIASLPSPVYAAAKGLPIKLVASLNVKAPGSYEAIIVRKGLNITEIEDLRGKRIAIGSKTGWCAIIMEYYFRQRGMTGRDYVPVEEWTHTSPRVIASFEAGLYDAAHSGEPYVTMAIKAGVAERLEPDEREKYRGPNNFIFFTNKFLEERPDAARKFLRAYVKGIEYTLQNETDTRLIIAKYSGLSPDIVMEMDVYPWTYTWPRDGVIDVEGVIKFEEMMMELGFLEKRAHVERIVDLTFLPR